MPVNHRAAVLRAGRRGAGSVLIEALVGSTVLAIALTGTLALLSQSLSAAASARYRQQADAIATVLLERARSNATGASAYEYDPVTDATPSRVDCSPSAPCAPADMATNDLADCVGMAAALPAGTLRAEAGADASGARTLVIVLEWRNPGETKPARYLRATRI